MSLPKGQTFLTRRGHQAVTVRDSRLRATRHSHQRCAVLPMRLAGEPSQFASHVRPATARPLLVRQSAKKGLTSPGGVSPRDRQDKACG